MKKQIVIIYIITILSFINNIILSIDTYISININNVYKFMPIGNIYETIKNKIKDMPKSLIISNRDSIALAALNASLDLNLNVPEDYEFMAMLGTKYSELSRPKLSSFSIDMRTLGKTGMNVLAELIENNNSELITKKLSFNYVKRGSTLQ